MKRLEIIIRPDKLEILKNILNARLISGITVTSVMGYGKQKRNLLSSAKPKSKPAVKISGMNLLPKIQAIVVVADSEVDEILNNIQEKLSTGKAGDGKIFVTNVENAMRIRTGERGDKAL
jgi:nitrogen regulatory protein P-II 1